MVPQVDILLATFNGEKYLRQQIQSIFLQSHQNFHLIIRDDGSTDATLKIVKEMITEFPQKVTLIEDKTHLGVIGSFCKLLSVSNACYIMFADQDDAWLSEKIAKSLAKMKDLEGLHGIEKPILVHSDLKVVDEKLELISPSYWAYTKIYPREGSHLNRLLVQNEITGCTVMINRSLANLSNPIFSGSVMHDSVISV
jgi:glycosyltransferase involved in cell wall biosynthesis